MVLWRTSELSHGKVERRRKWLEMIVLHVLHKALDPDIRGQIVQARPRHQGVADAHRGRCPLAIDVNIGAVIRHLEPNQDVVIDGDMQQGAVLADELMGRIPRQVAFGVVGAVVIQQKGIDQPLRLANAERVGRCERLDRACDPRLEGIGGWRLVAEGIHRVKEIALKRLQGDLGCALRQGALDSGIDALEPGILVEWEEPHAPLGH